MINCIIIDDEPLAISLLENHIAKIDDLKLIATAKNAVEAYKILQNQSVNVMFLDIQMPDLSGIEFLRSLNQKPHTVFTTAYREFAIEGFELEAVDYLLKPITFERFFKSVDRILRNVIKANEDDFMIFRSEGLYRKMQLNNIFYLESAGNNVKVFGQTDTFIASKISISELEVGLREKGFIRIHRSFLVNSARITALSSYEVVVGNTRIPVGRSYKKDYEYLIKKFLENA